MALVDGVFVCLPRFDAEKAADRILTGSLPWEKPTLARFGISRIMYLHFN
jgi:hypothetical protein